MPESRFTPDDIAFASVEESGVVVTGDAGAG